MRKDTPNAGCRLVTNEYVLLHAMGEADTPIIRIREMMGDALLDVELLALAQRANDKVILDARRAVALAEINLEGIGGHLQLLIEDALAVTEQLHAGLGG